MYIDKTFLIKAFGTNKSYKFRDTPSVCPLCHNGIAPVRIEGVVRQNELRAEVCFKCTFNNCEKMFIVRYGRDTVQDNDKFRFLESVPKNAKTPIVPDEVRDVSCSFVEIYEQALAAEAYGLTQMVGTGLRKAAEFLVRDYLIAHPPKKKSKDSATSLTKDEISKMPFTNLVEHHVDDAGIKNMALRAWWLGSDDVHYVRKYEKHDISDLKIIIRILIGWVEKLELTERYAAEIQRHGSVVAEDNEGSPA